MPERMLDRMSEYTLERISNRMAQYNTIFIYIFNIFVQNGFLDLFLIYCFFIGSSKKTLKILFIFGVGFQSIF